MNSHLVKNLVAAAALALVACGGPLTYKVASTPKAPGADATVVARVNTDSAQTNLDVKAIALPSPERINPKAKFYVAWVRPGEKAWSRLGTLKYSDSDKTGTLVATTPELAFDFQVTIEAENSVDVPSSDVIFSQPINKK